MGQDNAGNEHAFRLKLLANSQNEVVNSPDRDFQFPGDFLPGATFGQQSRHQLFAGSEIEDFGRTL
jgi:hypothetical protein